MTEAFEQLLEIYVLDKALYELMYELNNRPAWVRIPLAGILALPLRIAGLWGNLRRIRRKTGLWQR